MRNEDRTFAILAHLTVMLNLFTLILGTVAAGIIYLVTRKRRPFVAFHALQALLMQLVVWVGGAAVALASWLLAGALSPSIASICIMPLAFVISLVPVAAVVYAIFAAVDVSLDNDFRYYRAGDWALRLMGSG